jgi:hypothetical protein
MGPERALPQVVSSLQERAELRVRVAQDCGRTIIEAASLIAEGTPQFSPAISRSSTCLRELAEDALFGNAVTGLGAFGA